MVDFVESGEELDGLGRATDERCPECHEPVALQDVFCPACGEPLRNPGEAELDRLALRSGAARQLEWLIIGLVAAVAAVVGVVGGLVWLLLRA